MTNALDDNPQPPNNAENPRAGAERAAHFAVEFDPTSQRIDVHFIRVQRSDVQIDHAKPDAFQILRREKKFEQLALDGRLTATLLISDLRVASSPPAAPSSGNRPEALLSST